jgi:phage gp29-like protein
LAALRPLAVEKSENQQSEKKVKIMLNPQDYDAATLFSIFEHYGKDITANQRDEIFECAEGLIEGEKNKFFDLAKPAKNVDVNIELNLGNMTRAVEALKSATKWLNEARIAERKANYAESTDGSLARYQETVAELYKAEAAFDSAQHDCVNFANYFRTAVQEMSID